jgi:alpha-ketoglutarate-dependent taurine dioxygenase
MPTVPTDECFRRPPTLKVDRPSRAANRCNLRCRPPLIDFLVAHAAQHAFTGLPRREPGMVAMWDNRAAMHLAPNNYDGWRREMCRTTTAGAKPV